MHSRTSCFHCARIIIEKLGMAWDDTIYYTVSVKNVKRSRDGGAKSNMHT